MSTNIHICGERKMCLYDTATQQADTSRVWVDCNYFEVFQTPTDVTTKIMQSFDKIQANIDWIMVNSIDEQVPEYEKNDLSFDVDQIGYGIINAAKNHVEQFAIWLCLMKDEKFTVTFTAW